MPGGNARASFDAQQVLLLLENMFKRFSNAMHDNLPICKRHICCTLLLCNSLSFFDRKVAQESSLSEQ